MANANCRLRWLRKPALAGAGAYVFSGVLVIVLAAGCAHSDKHKEAEPAASMGGIPAPKPPVFLNGTLAQLFTNADGFRARAVLETPPTDYRNHITSGELMGRAGKLFFAPEPGSPADKHARAEDFSYIWDVNERRGYLLSGPLQGYAPISSNVRFTNIVVRAGDNGSGPERVGGHPCEQSNVRMAASDGTEADLHVWRANDLKGLPVRVTGTVQGTTLTFTLSKIRLELPPDDLFAPPPDFTKYTSAELMMNELVTRQENVKRKRGWQPPPSDQVGAMDVHNPGASTPH